MVKKQVQKVPLGQASRFMRDLDTEIENEGESSEMEMKNIIDSLIAEFDSLDSSLILALLSDYSPTTIHSDLNQIREQLGILQASAVPDGDSAEGFEGAPDPSTSTSTSDIADLLERTNLLNGDELDGRGRSTPPSSWKMAEKGKKGKRSKGSKGTTSVSTSTGLSVKTGSGLTSGTGSGSRSSETGSVGSAGLSPDVEGAGLDDEMGLLRSLFPNLKKAELRTALDDAISVQAAIDQLLSVELIRDVEQNGHWPGEDNLTDDEGFQEAPLKRTTSGSSIEVPTPMSRSGSASSRTSTKKAKPRHYALIDTLQRVPTPSSHSASRAQSPAPLARSYGLSGPAPNAWHTLASLAAQLADLLPPQTDQYFISFLHSPEYRSAHSAVHAALSRLPAVPLPADSSSEAVLQDLFGLSLTEGDKDNAARKQGDLKVAMRVGGEDVGVVMDLVDVLDEISHWPGDEDVFDRYGGSEDELEAPERISPITPTSAKTPLPPSNLPLRLKKPKKLPPAELKPKYIPGSEPAASSAAFPTARDDFGTPPASPRINAPSLMPSNRRQVHPLNWRKVEHERTVRDDPKAANMPTYARGMIPDEMSVSDCLERAALERHKRETAIRAAGHHFGGGGRHLAGGKSVNASVAGHYASQARTAGDSARSWELKAARLVVGAQLQRTGNTVDLHHLTTNEAVVVAKEVVTRWYDKQKAGWGTANSMVREGVFVPGRPMTIVTGVGNHSAGKRGVLGPAVAAALEKEGWKVERGENARGYIVVRGKR